MTRMVGELVEVSSSWMYHLVIVAWTIVLAALLLNGMECVVGCPSILSSPGTSKRLQISVCILTYLNLWSSVVLSRSAVTNVASTLATVRILVTARCITIV